MKSTTHHHHVLGLIAAAALLAPAGAGAVETPVDLKVPASTAGRISSTGVVGGPNYLTGRFGGETYRGFATFDLPMIASYTETSSFTEFHYTGGSWVRRMDRDLNPLNPTPAGLQPGEIFAWQWVGNFSSHTTTHTAVYQPLDLSAVSLLSTIPGGATASGDSLLVHDYNATGTGLERFADLGSGTLYGTVTSPGTTFSMPLDPGSVGLRLAVGFDLPTASDGEYVFGGSGSPIGLAIRLQGNRDISENTVHSIGTESPSHGTYINDLDGYTYDVGRYKVDGYVMFEDRIYTSDAALAPLVAALPRVPEPGAAARGAAAGLLVFALARLGWRRRQT